ncbi:hypothetical protein ACFL52_04155 [Candidatus Margulisiibacteriota bacterium]
MKKVVLLSVVMSLILASTSFAFFGGGIRPMTASFMQRHIVRANEKSVSEQTVSFKKQGRKSRLLIAPMLGRMVPSIRMPSF